MIEKIYIPTLHRVDDQVAYNHLPHELKEKVVLVVQEWEREQYKYPVEYLVLPPEINKEDKYCLAKTRNFIYQTAGKRKYVMMDDDVKFGRRNRKYFGEESNMDITKRYLEGDEIIELFDKFDAYLDEYPVCGCYPMNLPPPKKEVGMNKPTYNAMFLNGAHFYDDLKSFKLTKCRTGEDVCFMLNMLTNGHQIRRDHEYLVYNDSFTRVDSYIWDTQTDEDTLRDIQTLAELFPALVTYEENGGGYKSKVKMKVKWKDAYNNSASLYD